MMSSQEILLYFLYILFILHCQVLELRMPDLNATLGDFPLIKCQFEDVQHNKEKQRNVREKILNKVGAMGSLSLITSLPPLTIKRATSL